MSDIKGIAWLSRHLVDYASRDQNRMKKNISDLKQREFVLSLRFYFIY